MAPQLLHVVGGRASGSQALSAFLEIQQGDFGLRRLAFSGHADKHMLDVEASMLPAALVHTSQVCSQRLEDMVMYGLAVTFASASGIPVFDFLEAIHRVSHQ